MNLRRGLLRLWIVGSVGWAGYVFLDSGALSCLVGEAAPWCNYRNGHYYIALAIGCVLPPALVGLAILVTAWIAAGFRTKPNSN